MRNQDADDIKDIYINNNKASMDKWSIPLINKLCSVEYELNLRKVCMFDL